MKLKSPIRADTEKYSMSYPRRTRIHKNGISPSIRIFSRRSSKDETSISGPFLLVAECMMKLQTNNCARARYVYQHVSSFCSMWAWLSHDASIHRFDFCHPFFALSVPLLFSIFVGLVAFDVTQYQYNVNIPEQQSYSPHVLF